MLTGLYSAATGLNASERLHEVVAENLAHVADPGYRANVVSFRSMDGRASNSAAAPSARGSGVLAEELTTDFTVGPMVHTGRTLDVAIMGDGFFVVQGPKGPLYTRNGVFFLDAAGTLVNSTGMPVQGRGGPIILPPDVSTEEISIGRDGSVTARGSQVGQLQTAVFADDKSLVRAGTTLFSAPAGVSSEDTTVAVLQGSREQSNVSAVHELVRMIVGTRHYEAAQRALSALDQAISQNTKPQA